jgi:hypothetical protein
MPSAERALFCCPSSLVAHAATPSNHDMNTKKEHDQNCRRCVTAESVKFHPMSIPTRVIRSLSSTCVVAATSTSVQTALFLLLISKLASHGTRATRACIFKRQSTCCNGCRCSPHRQLRVRGPLLSLLRHALQLNASVKCGRCFTPAHAGQSWCLIETADGCSKRPHSPQEHVLSVLSHTARLRWRRLKLDRALRGKQPNFLPWNGFHEPPFSFHCLFFLDLFPVLTPSCTVFSVASAHVRLGTSPRLIKMQVRSTTRLTSVPQRLPSVLRRPHCCITGPLPTRPRRGRPERKGAASWRAPRLRLALSAAESARLGKGACLLTSRRLRTQSW